MMLQYYKHFTFINAFYRVVFCYRYITYTEWTTLYGGKRVGPETTGFRRLPFDHCCLCLKPFENPYCDNHGNIFELQAIVAYLKKFKTNPVTGEVGLFLVTDMFSLYHYFPSSHLHCLVVVSTFFLSTCWLLLSCLVLAERWNV
jgi:hypothetical protein